jgi:butyrate kinase
MDDADIEVAVAAATGGAFGSTGQKCTASSRLVVHESIHDEFVDRMQKSTSALKVGHALEEGTQIGPASSEEQLASNLKYMDLARQEGCEVVCGGEQLELNTPGFYMQPALLIGGNNSMRVNREELFAPITGYLTHGVAAERVWDKNRGARRIALRKVIDVNKELGTKFVARLAADMAKSIPHAKAYISNPVVVDELSDIARYSGHKLLPRVSVFHALNQKAVARQHARSVLRKYEEMNMIVVHMGGGITVGAHQQGRVIDVNQGLDGDGPFSPERTGTLPVGALVRLCFSGKYSLKQVLKMNKGEGGLVSYLGTNSAYEVEKRVAAGDKEAEQVYEAMAYQVAKEIGSMYAVLKGEVDAILITGGVAHSKWFVNKISERVFKMAPIHTYPGEDEMKALAFNGLRIVRGEAEAKVYQ